MEAGAGVQAWNHRKGRTDDGDKMKSRSPAY
jgi:hypothetical protein